MDPKIEGIAMTDFNKLQNGSIIIGEAGADASEEIAINKETAGQITGAFAYWLSQKAQKNPVMLNICVGRDDNPLTEEAEEGAFEAIALWGAGIHDAGVATCEAVSKAPVLPCFEIDGSLMIAFDGGNSISIHLFSPEGEPTEAETEEILRLASRYNFIGGEYEKEDINLMQMYKMYAGRV